MNKVEHEGCLFLLSMAVIDQLLSGKASVRLNGKPKITIVMAYTARNMTYFQQSSQAYLIELELHPITRSRQSSDGAIADSIYTFSYCFLDL